MDVRKKIDNLRRSKGWSLAKFAHELGISNTSVYNWYNINDSMPTVRVLEDVCRLFDISMSELFCDAELDKLAPKQLRLLELFDKLTPKQQECIVELINSL